MNGNVIKTVQQRIQSKWLAIVLKIHNCWAANTHIVCKGLSKKKERETVMNCRDTTGYRL